MLHSHGGGVAGERSEGGGIRGSGGDGPSEYRVSFVSGHDGGGGGGEGGEGGVGVIVVVDIECGIQSGQGGRQSLRCDLDAGQHRPTELRRLWRRVFDEATRSGSARILRRLFQIAPPVVGRIPRRMAGVAEQRTSRDVVGPARVRIDVRFEASSPGGVGYAGGDRGVFDFEGGGVASVGDAAVGTSGGVWV